MPGGSLTPGDTYPRVRVCSSGRGLSTGWELCYVQYMLPKFSSEGIPDRANPAPPSKAPVNKDVVKNCCQAHTRDPYCNKSVSFHTELTILAIHDSSRRGTIRNM